MSNYPYRPAYSQAGSSPQQQQQQHYQQYQQYQQQPHQQQHYQQQQQQSAMMTDEEMELEISADDAEHWENIADPIERRKMQNRIAQRRFRKINHISSILGIFTDWVAGAKKKEEREEARREQDNRARAGSAYQSPEPREIADERELSGLPWGGLSMRHMVQTSRTNQEEQARRGSQEASNYVPISRAGGSAR